MEDPVSDQAPECIDEADVALGDAAFVPSGCSADPAVAVIEVTLLTMEITGTVHTAPATEHMLTDEEMNAILHEQMSANACDDPRIPWGYGEIVDNGPFAWLTIPPMDLGASGLFDTRTGELVYAHPTFWCEWEPRCIPNGPMGALDTGTAPAADPAACHGADDGCAVEIDWLNHYGVHTTCDPGCWFERTYDQVWALASHTALVNAFAACGGYEMFVEGLSIPPGGYCVPRDANKMIFVLAGRVDLGVLE